MNTLTGLTNMLSRLCYLDQVQAALFLNLPGNAQYTEAVEYSCTVVKVLLEEMVIRDAESGAHTVHPTYLDYSWDVPLESFAIHFSPHSESCSFRKAGFVLEVHAS